MEPFLGQITLFAGTFAPKGWADCAGQLLPITQNTALFSLLGTNFGGNGISNFALPDLRGRVPVGQGQGKGLSPYFIGDVEGVESVTLTPSQSAIHSHNLNAANTNGSTNAPEGKVLGRGHDGPIRGGDVANTYNPATPDTTLGPKSIVPAGGGATHNNMQPFLTLRYCIALSGIFPQRQ